MGRTSDARPRLMCAAMQLCWRASYSSATIDDLCAVADVRKGSFYHFFRSKSDLVIAALDGWVEELRPDFDRIFSASQSGRVRLTKYVEWVVDLQLKNYAIDGKILGCPLFTLGCEVSTLDSPVCEKVQEILKVLHCYLESAIRDGVAQKDLIAANPSASARDLMSLVQGTLAQARICNDPQMVQALPATLAQWFDRTGMVKRSSLPSIILN